MTATLFYQNTLTVAFSGTRPTLAYSCPCSLCADHDFQYRRIVQRAEDRALVAHSRRTNYLAPYIARLDRAIERVRAFA
ncbi:MAG: hypothetical protein AB7I04_18490 [Pseudomonadales bacterium]